MPPRIDDTTRAAILHDIRTGDLSASRIAKKHGVAQSTVSKIAKDAGIAAAFDRSKTRDATRAREADLAKLRADLAVRRTLAAAELHDVYEREIAKMTAPTKYWDWGGKEHDYDEVTQPEPHAQDRRAMMATASQAVATSLKLVPLAEDTGADAARSMLGRLMTGLQAVYEEAKAEEAGQDEPSP